MAQLRALVPTFERNGRAAADASQPAAASAPAPVVPEPALAPLVPSTLALG